MITLLCRPELTVRTAATDAGNLNVVSVVDSNIVHMIESQSAGATWPHSTSKLKMGVPTTMDSTVKIGVRSLNCTDLWHWPVHHGVHRSEIDRKSTFLLYLYKEKCSRSSARKFYLCYKNRALTSQSIPGLQQSVDPEPLCKGEAEFP